MSYVKDSIDYVVSLMRGVGDVPLFEHGTKLDISNKLTIKDKSASAKFPLVCLIVPPLGIPESYFDGMYHARFTIVICTRTKIEYLPEQRHDLVIDPILEPLVTLFFKKLRIAGKFSWRGELDRPRHSRNVIPLWGVPGTDKTLKNYFNDCVDAIELKDLEINYRTKTC